MNNQHNLGCLHCGFNVQKLFPHTELYFEFGGWMVYKDDKLFYMNKENEAPKKLEDVEKAAKVFPESKWIAELSLPLKGAKYQRNQSGDWLLIEENEGFA